MKARMCTGPSGVYQMNMQRALMGRRMPAAVALVLCTQFFSFLPFRTATVDSAYGILYSMNLFDLQQLTPSICAWVFANALLYDMKSGFLRHIGMRTTKKAYTNSMLLFSFAAAFLASAAGIAITVGLLGARFGFDVSGKDMENLMLLGGSTLIAENRPFAFCCFHAMVRGLSCGVWAVCALMFSVLFMDAAVAIMSPLMVMYTMLFVISLFGDINLWGKTVWDWYFTHDIFNLGTGLDGSSRPLSFMFTWCICFMPILILSCVVYHAVANKRMRDYV